MRRRLRQYIGIQCHKNGLYGDQKGHPRHFKPFLCDRMRFFRPAHGKRAARWGSPRALTKPTTAKIAPIKKKSEAIFASGVSQLAACGHLRPCKLPWRQVGFLGLRAFSTLCQSVDFVNILAPRQMAGRRKMGRAGKKGRGKRGNRAARFFPGRYAHGRGKSRLSPPKRRRNRFTCW